MTTEPIAVFNITGAEQPTDTLAVIVAEDLAGWFTVTARRLDGTSVGA